jgi:hypothetical protein
MGNLINVPIRFEFHFVGTDQSKAVQLKIRRRRLLRDALKIGLTYVAQEGSWRVSSFSASPPRLIDAMERVRCAGTLVVYLEPGGNVKDGVDLSVRFDELTLINFSSFLVIELDDYFRYSLKPATSCSI